VRWRMMGPTAVRTDRWCRPLERARWLLGQKRAAPLLLAVPMRPWRAAARVERRARGHRRAPASRRRRDGAVRGVLGDLAELGHISDGCSGPGVPPLSWYSTVRVGIGFPPRNRASSPRNSHTNFSLPKSRGHPVGNSRHAAAHCIHCRFTPRTWEQPTRRSGIHPWPVHPTHVGTVAAAMHGRAVPVHPHARGNSVSLFPRACCITVHPTTWGTIQNWPLSKAASVHPPRTVGNRAHSGLAM